MQTADVELRVEASALLEVADARGKHRIQAELKRLEQEARFLEKEMEELDKTDRVSIACQEYVSFVLFSHVHLQFSYLLKQQLDQLTQLGTVGLKGPKIHKVADAGYFEDT
ncbi:Guanine nucleotide-binding protein subunit gamma 2 [Nymphaea thermarum]|nr:Guanine nucleotide-binding protein subunit gamma 2 [Nymphaea thermarum]